ncbi:MAG: rhamnogalacturonan acetylesterase [Bacteroidota bacterium]
MRLLKSFFGISLLLCSFAFPQEKEIVVYLVGDSTCADKSPQAFPEMGWGTPFKTFFNDSVRIENRAVNGRSTKSFINEGRWSKIIGTLKAGDYVFIQFGHNDEVPTKATATKPDEFKNNLRRYVDETRAKNAIPILLTSVTRRSFENGVLKDTHMEYMELTKGIAKEMDVPLIDVNKKSMDLLNEWGEEKSQLLYHHLEPGEHPNYPNGRVDNTHFNELGARKMAQLVLKGIQELDLALKEQIISKNP